MIDIDAPLAQIKRGIIRPALTALGLDTDTAVNLMTGIGLVESQYRYLQQLGGGPARGYWQMEPATHDDCWENFLRHPAQSRLSTALNLMMAHDLTRLEQLQTNLRYACAMARIRLYRAPAPLPEAGDAAGMSQYWKRFYNTSEGAGSALNNTPAFQRAIDA